MPATHQPVKPASPEKTTAEEVIEKKCYLTNSIEAGGVIVHFKIDPQDWTRLQRRMGAQDPATFMWENYLYRMIMNAVY